MSDLAVGIYDYPQKQKQPVFYLDLYKSNVAVFGGPMAGKTTFIKTLLVRMSEKKQNPREDIYIIDFGGNLGPYGQLSNVCACFSNDNEENIKSVFKALERRLKENAELLGSDNFQTFALKEPEKCPAHLTLIIDNVSAFISDERYETYQDVLLKFCRDGLSKGLSVVMTANDITGMTRLLANCAQKIAFEMPVENYYEIFNSKVLVPMAIPGRGIINKGNENYEFQCFLPFEDENSGLAEMIKRQGNKKNENYMMSFPTVLNYSNIAQYWKIEKDDKEVLQSQDSVLVGLDYYEHRPICLNVKDNRAIAIYGKRQFGKTNLLIIIVSKIIKKHGQVRFVLFDDGREELKSIKKICTSNGVELEYFLSIEKLKKYLTDNGYYIESSEERNGYYIESSEEKNGQNVEKIQNNPYTVFILQGKMLYQSSKNAKYVMSKQIPYMIANAEKNGNLLLFSDVRNFADPDIRDVFNNNISAAFLLDNIGDFVADRGNRSIFGEMNARELKSEYAECSIGDGYLYDIGREKLKKVKFLKI